MADLKMEEIRGLDDADIEFQVKKLRRELFDLNCKSATESLDNPNEISGMKRSIARLLTEQRQRELARQRNP